MCEVEGGEISNLTCKTPGGNTFSAQYPTEYPIHLVGWSTIGQGVLYEADSH